MATLWPFTFWMGGPSLETDMLAAEIADSILRSSQRIKATWLGYCLAMVTSNQDPIGTGRIKVRFPWMRPDVESDWVPKGVGLNLPSGGETFSVPEPGDIVLVHFIGGDIHKPVYGNIFNAANINYNTAESFPEMEGGDDPIAKGFQGWKKGRVPISTKDRQDAIDNRRAYIAPDRKDRINLWRSRGGWRLWLDELGRRLRFWADDAKPNATHRLDLQEASDAASFLFSSPRGVQLEIAEDDDNLTLTIRLPSGWRMELADQQGDISGLFGKPSGVRYTFSSADGTDKLTAVAPQSESEMEIGPNGFILKTNNDFKVEAGGRFVLNANAVTIQAEKALRMRGERMDCTSDTDIKLVGGGKLWAESDQDMILVAGQKLHAEATGTLESRGFRIQLTTGSTVDIVNG